MGMIHRVRSLVTVLALCVPSIAAADQVKRKGPDPVSTFLTQDKYTYCDVKLLSALWKQSVSDAKATIGIKLQAKSDPTIDKMLVDARAAAKKTASLRCTFAEAGFSYEDAATLAKLWKKTESAAKVLAEDKILAGGEKNLRAILKKGGTTTPAQEDPTATFLKQDTYTYCDVKLLTKLWKTSTDQAKATIGLKIQSKNDAYLKSELVTARKNKSVICTYSDAFSYADIEKIAKRWGVPISQAKMKVGLNVRAGNAASIRADLNSTVSPDNPDLQAYLKQNKYTYCDAAQIAAMWKTSVEEGKTFIGAKLRLGSAQSVDNTLVQARKQPPVDGCKKTAPAPTKPVPPPPPPAPKKM